MEMGGQLPPLHRLESPRVGDQLWIMGASGFSVQKPPCRSTVVLLLTARYLLYDVNPPEGFNLRRDVYIRIASLLKTLLKTEEWVLVLPPWGRLYHWQSPDIHQVRIPWSDFFDLPSLNRNIPVIEYEQFIAGEVVALLWTVGQAVRSASGLSHCPPCRCLCSTEGPCILPFPTLHSGLGLASVFIKGQI